MMIKIYFENFEYLFEEEVLNRMKTKKYFEEPELWYLLYSLVTNANSFARLQQKIGDIRPYNIFINESGQIKVANIYSWPQENTNFDKTAYEKHLTYLSP